MSIEVAEWPWLSVGPRIERSAGKIRIRTSAVLQALSFGAHGIETSIDPRARQITLERRIRWRRQPRVEIGFSDVREVFVRRFDYPTSFDLASLIYGSLDSVERYEVGIRTRRSELDEIRLFSFVGEGSHVTGTLGVLLGDDVLDLRGSQRVDALGLAEELGELLGVPTVGGWGALGREPERDELGRLRFCRDCRRGLGPKAPHCYFCGSKELEWRGSDSEIGAGGPAAGSAANSSVEVGRPGNSNGDCS